MNTAPIKRRILEGAQGLVRKRETSVEDISAVTQPLAELVSAETGMTVEIVLKVKRHKQRDPLCA